LKASQTAFESGKTCRWSLHGPVETPQPLALFGYAFTAIATRRLESLPCDSRPDWAFRGMAGPCVRSPAKKALLAADVPADAYGRAFGLERLMDTLARSWAIDGVVDSQTSSHSYLKFSCGRCCLMIAFCVSGCWYANSQSREKKQNLFCWDCGAAQEFRRFLLAVGIFGAGDFSHTLLILYAMKMLAAEYGMARRRNMAVILYMLHNVFYAASAYLSGMAERSCAAPQNGAGAGYGLQW